MSLFVFNNQQKLIKSIPNRDLISVVQDQAINVSDTLFVEMPADIWSNLKEPASYLAVQDPYERFSYHMYKVSKYTTKADTTDVEAIQIGYDELKAYGYIKDRRFNNRPVLEAATAIVDGTDWQLGYVDTDLPNVNTNFYYISRLEALSKLIEATGAEVRFRVEISGNKIIAKRLDLYKQLGTFKGKRFAYGSNLLEIIKEEDTSELYTALVGRGKGEETDTGGFGRRITFADIDWSKASGKPADKPLGQEFIELPEMTAYYGYPDGEPRTGIVEFGDIEEPELLLKATYERLIETSRPQVQFKAKVQTTGDMQLGEEVAIIRSDLGFRYKTRVFRVKRDYLNNMFTEVELGDKLTETLASRIKKIDVTNARREETIIQYIQTAANGKNKIFRGPIEPTEGMMVNDLWYKPVGEGETMLYTWNGEIWELSKVSAGLLGGTLDAENGDVNLINVNVANIVGETSNFVLSNWNDNLSDVKITASGVVTSSIDGSYSRLVSGEVRSYNASGGTSAIMGNGRSQYYIGGSSHLIIGNTLHGSDYIGETSLQIAHTRNFVIGRYNRETHEAGVKLIPYITFDYGSAGNEDTGRMRFSKEIDLIASGFNFRSATQAIGRVGQVGISQNIGVHADSVLLLGVNGGGNYASPITIKREIIQLSENLDMQGRAMINHSDTRLKTNITDSDYDVLSEIERIRVIYFEWDKSNPLNTNKPDGVHFGVQAQSSPFLQTKSPLNESYLSIDLTKQINFNTLLAKKLNEERLKHQLAIDKLEETVTNIKNSLIESEM